MANVVGIMSGTSLDGLDLAYCKFEGLDKIQFKILAAATIEYPVVWKNRLKNCENASAQELAQLDTEYAIYCAQQVDQFIKNHNLHSPDLLAFHGHTIFHRPDLKYTFQIGSGSTLAALSRIDTVSDFRSANVAIGGQGAPLVPIGDLHLFSEFEICLNLGGFANVSQKIENELIAFDLCPANMALNELAHLANKEYDINGDLAKSGVVNNELLHSLESLNYYSQNPPKSLGREWYLTDFKPIIESHHCSVNDKLSTVCEHIAIQISKQVKSTDNSIMLVTGGGTKNTHLIQRIEKYFMGKLEIPSNQIIDFKEALVFAYLGYLRLHKRPNCLTSYTGGSRDICSGTYHLA